jgi:glycerophosphoryl diester phosphodiesterase
LAVLFTVLIAPRTIGSASLDHMAGYHYTHRGYHDGNVAIPENSLPSFQAAIDAGYGIELDIQLSSDKVPMVFHDADLERICGVEGKIWDYTCAELQQMKLFDTQETIPTLAEALALIDSQVPILVEYKMDKVDTDVCAYSHELLKDYEGPYAIQSFHPFALFWYRQNAKDIPRGILAKNFIRDNKEKGEESDIIDFLTTNLMLNVIGYPDFIAFDYQDADYFALKLTRLMGAPTSTWTLKDPAHYEQVKGQFDLYTFEGFAMQ